MEAYDSWEHAGLIVEIVHDDYGIGDPQDNDNAGTIYSWDRWFKGDEQIGEPDFEILCPICEGEGTVATMYWPGADWEKCRRCDGAGVIFLATLGPWFAEHYDAALTIPLRYSDERNGARIYECDDEDANCALVFTQEEIDEEWDGHVEAYPVPVWRSVKDADGQWKSVRDGTGVSGARPYAKARINELDQWLRGNVWGIVIKDSPMHVLDSCWGFIGEEDSDWIRDEANGIAEAAREEIEDEVREAAYWAYRDVMTV